jgi:hypothetical protein
MYDENNSRIVTVVPQYRYSIQSNLHVIIIYYICDMTRINVGIDPKTLNRQMLIAEHREIKRIPNVIKSGRFSMTNQPSEFTLGTGHVKFFYDKILFLKKEIRIYLQ